jgi:hypothetical protein
MSMPEAARVSWPRLDRTRLGDGFWYVLVVAAGIIVARWGLGTRTFVLLGALVGASLLSFPAWFWAAAALGATLLARILSTAGLVPGIVNFADFGFVYLGLLAVIVRHPLALPWPPLARRLGRALAGLLLVTWMAWLLHPLDLARPLVTFLLWAQPFVLVLLLLLDPPSVRQRRLLLAWFGILALAQLPFAIYQATTLGIGDAVEGTLLGTGAGAHVMAGVAALAGLALLAWGYHHSLGRGLLASAAAIPFLIVLPILGDAKQVIFALPAAAIVLALSARGLLGRVGTMAPMLGAIIVLLVAVPAGAIALDFLQGASEGRSGKFASARVVIDEMGPSLSNWALGLGPANGVSRAAFMTTPLFLDADSPVALLGLRPATLPARAQAEAIRVASGSSFNSPTSSALGVFGDVGVVGALTFGWVLLCVCLPLVSSRRYWLAQAALAGWALSAPLAFTFDWWEQPPFMLSLAVLTGLALTSVHAQRDKKETDEDRSRP